MQDPCSIVGHKEKYFLFDKTGIQHNVTIQGGKGCQLRVLAVGGGVMLQVAMVAQVVEVALSTLPTLICQSPLLPITLRWK